MDHLFSFLFAIGGAAILITWVFSMVRLKYSAWSALGLAVRFSGGAAIAFVLAVFVVVLVMGSGPIQRTSLDVGLYLGWLAFASFAGGIFAAVGARDPGH